MLVRKENRIISRCKKSVRENSRIKKYRKENKELYSQSFSDWDDWDDIEMELDNVDTLMNDNYIALDVRHIGDSYNSLMDIIGEEDRHSSELSSVDVYEIKDGIIGCDVSFSNHDGGYTRCFASCDWYDVIDDAVAEVLKDSPITKEDTDALCDDFVDAAKENGQDLDDALRYLLHYDSNNWWRVIDWVLDGYDLSELTTEDEDGNLSYDVQGLKKLCSPQSIMKVFKKKGTEEDDVIIDFLCGESDTDKDHLIACYINKIAGNKAKSHTPGWWELK